MYLLDTDVLSALSKRRRSPRLEAWIGKQRPEDLFISVVCIGEIERGIGLQQRTDKEFALHLAAWLDRLLSVYRDRILPFDLAASRRWGQLGAKLGHLNADLQIAATARDRGLTVATRNVSDFLPTGVAVVNPFDP